MKKYFTVAGYVFIFLLVLLFMVWIIRAIFFWLFPGLMQTLKGELEVHLFSVGVLVLLIFVGFIIAMISSSINGEDFIKRIIKIVIGIGILVLAYWVYPAGIMDTPIAMITLGSIGRLFIVLMLAIAFIIDVYCLICDIP